MFKAIRFCLFVVIAYFVLPCFLTGCPEVKVACQVIKVADDACTVLDFVGEDGQHHQVPVSKQDLEGFAKAAAARQDAGVDSGSKH